MTVEQPLDSKEVQTFQFKLICRLNVCSDPEFDYDGYLNLVATASKYGLAFIGCPSGVQAIITSAIVSNESVGSKVLNEYSHRKLKLNNRPSHLSLSCDQSFIVIGLKKDGCAHALIYSVLSFFSKDIVLLNEIRLSASPNVSILDLTWNPGIPNILANCLSDGTVGVYEFRSTGTDIKALPPEAQATCFSWSPRGKQLVVGTRNGELTQYKPDLKPVKTLPAPTFCENPVSVINVTWISNYQFAAVYHNKVNETERPALVIVNAPKSGAVSFVNFDDICYSSGELRKPQFYLLHQQSWNLMLVASANSMEVGVVGLTEDQVSWQQWVQEDTCRAELPMSSDKQETYPVGLALDTSTKNELPWGDNQMISPMPVLHILSHKGVLCLFYVINVTPGASAVCSPPEKAIDESSIALFPIKTPDRSSVADTSTTGSRINLAQKFENVSIPKALMPIQNSTPQKSTTILNPQVGISEPGVGMLNSGFSAPLFSVKVPVSSTPEKPKSVINLSATHSAVAANTSSFPAGKVTGANLTPAPVMVTSPSNVAFSTHPLITASHGSMQTEVTPVKADNSGKPSIDLTVMSTPSNEITVSVIRAAITEEIQSFERELEDLQKRIGNVNTHVGTMEERALLQKKVEHMEEFCHELEDTTRAQTTEVQALRGLMMETFVWLEDAKSRQRKIAKPSELKELPLLQDLDPVILHYWTSIQQSMFYVESQLKQLNDTLDLDWLQFQNACKKNSGSTLQVPTLEAIYKVLTLENSILIKKRADVEKIIKQVDQYRRRQGKRTSLLSSFNSSKRLGFDKGENDISRLAEKLLHSKLLDTDGIDPDNMKKMVSINRLAAVSAREKKLSSKKLSALHDLLMQHVASHITPVKTVRDKFSTSSSVLNLPPFSKSTLKLGGISSGKPVAHTSTPTTQIPLHATSDMQQKVEDSLAMGDTGLSLSLNMTTSSNLDKMNPLTSLNNVLSGVASGSNESVDIASLSAFNRSGGTSLPAVKQFDDSQNILTVQPVTEAKGIVSTVASSVSASVSSGPPITAAFMFNASSGKGVSPGFSFVQSVQPSLFGGQSGKKEINVSTSNQVEQTQFSTPSATVSKSSTEARQLNSSNLFVSKVSNSAPSIFGSSTLGFSTSAIVTSKSEASALADKSQTEFHSKATSQPSDDGSTVSTKSLSTPFSFGSGLPHSTGFAFLKTASASVQSSHSTVFSFLKTSSVSVQSSQSVFGTSISKGNNPQVSSSSLSETTLSSVANTQATSLFAGTGNKNTSILSSADQVISGNPITSEVSSMSSPSVSSSVFAANQDKVSVAMPAFSFGQFTILSKPDKEIVASNTSSTIASVFGASPSKVMPAFSFGQLGATVTSSSMEAPKVESVTISAAPESLSVSSRTESKVADPTNTIVAVSKPLPQISPEISSIVSPEIPSFSFSISNSQSAVPNQSTTYTTSSTFFGQPICSVSSSGQIGANIFSQATVSKQVFGNLSATTNIFGAAPSNVTVTKSVFDAPSTDTPSSVSSPSLFASTSKNIPTFGTASETVFSSSTSLFGVIPSASTTLAQPGTSTPPPALGDVSPVTPVTIRQEIISESESNTRTTAPVTVSLPNVSSPALFSVSAAAPSTMPSMFNTNVTPVASTTSALFGSLTPTAVTTATLFGVPVTTVAPVAVAAIASSTTTTTTTTTSTVSSVFGGAGPAGTLSSMFGGVSITTSAPSLFGVSASTSTSASSPFGSPATTSTPAFGTSTTTSITSLFGTVLQQPSAPSLFGQPQTSQPATPSLFGNATATTGTSLFGGGTDKPSLFGGTSTQASASSIFGGKHVFGQSPVAASSLPFGQTTNAFGQNTTSVFGGGAAEDGFGSKPVFGQTGNPAFGQTPRFGSSNSSFGGGTSLFGGSGTTGNTFQTGAASTTGSLFGGANTAATHSNSTFSAAAGQGVGQAGFGSSPNFQNKQGGFGSPPVFGSASPGSGTGFGAQPTFGGTPTFGGSPTFGSPNRLFGNNSTGSPGFGGLSSGQQQSSTFESLASQNTLSFGNLANQSTQSSSFGSPQPSLFGGTQAPPPNTAPAFSSSNTSFGGSSFSSWR